MAMDLSVMIYVFEGQKRNEKIARDSNKKYGTTFKNNILTYIVVFFLFQEEMNFTTL